MSFLVFFEYERQGKTDWKRPLKTRKDKKRHRRAESFLVFEIDVILSQRQETHQERQEKTGKDKKINGNGSKTYKDKKEQSQDTLRVKSCRNRYGGKRA